MADQGFFGNMGDTISRGWDTTKDYFSDWETDAEKKKRLLAEQGILAEDIKTVAESPAFTEEQKASLDKLKESGDLEKQYVMNTLSDHASPEAAKAAFERDFGKDSVEGNIMQQLAAKEAGVTEEAKIDSEAALMKEFNANSEELSDIASNEQFASALGQMSELTGKKKKPQAGHVSFAPGFSGASAYQSGWNRLYGNGR